MEHRSSTRACHVYCIPACIGLASHSESGTNSDSAPVSTTPQSQYLMDCCTLISDITNFRHPCSVSNRQFFVPCYCLRMFGHCTYSVARNALPNHLRDSTRSNASFHLRLTQVTQQAILVAQPEMTMWLTGFLHFSLKFLKTFP